VRVLEDSGLLVGIGLALAARFIPDSSPPTQYLWSKRKIPNARGVRRRVAKFEIYRDAGGEYRWRLRADNNEVVASGEGYRSRDDCEHAVQLIKEQAPQAEVDDAA
jgi:uncharacterized protein YegP (UPF0339 family)